MVGVLSRTVAHTARVFDAYSGRTSSRPDNQRAAGHRRPPPRKYWVESLDSGALRGDRLGVLRDVAGQARPEVGRFFHDTRASLRAAGAPAHPTVCLRRLLLPPLMLC